MEVDQKPAVWPVAAAAASAAETETETEEEQRERLELELEFVQCLANPHYLRHLAQSGYLKDKAFINYLSYLQYWKLPVYAKLLRYPQCLYFLAKLQNEAFRTSLLDKRTVELIAEQQYYYWANNAASQTTNRLS